MNKIRRVAEQLVERYPTLFTADFEKNKGALATVSVVSTRSMRNQLAGAITKLVHARGPVASAESGEEPGQEGGSMLEERLNAERRESEGMEESSEKKESLPEASTSSDRSSMTQDENETKKETISEAAV